MSERCEPPLEWADAGGQGISARDVIAGAVATTRHPRTGDLRVGRGAKKRADAILSTLAAAGLVVEQGWQPIETAPQDRMVLVYAPSPDPTRWHTTVCDLLPIVCAAKWHPEGGWCVCEIREVTHWRPLPTPPQEASDDAK